MFDDDDEQDRIRSQFDYDVQKENMNNLMVESLESGNVIDLTYAIEHDADVEDQLDVFIEYGDMKNLSLLLQAGANLRYAMNSAIAYDKEEIMIFIHIEHDVALDDVKDNYMKMAIENDAVNAAIWLLKNNVPLDKSYAKKHGKEKIQKWLLSLELENELSQANSIKIKNKI